MLDRTLDLIRPIIPKRLFGLFQPAYHLSLAFLSAVIYRFPSRHIKVIGVTGTKGKSSTVEIISAILEEAGYRTALSNTIRFKVGHESERNLYKMSMPGRFAVQRLIRRAVNAGCGYAVIEMTSQGSLLSRHRFIDIDALVFTNLSPEHIEAHGSYESYRDAKLAIARSMEGSWKDTAIVANADDPEAEHFLACDAKRKIRFGLADASPYEVKPAGLAFTFSGMRMESPLSGLFNLYNIIAAATLAKSEGVEAAAIARAVAAFGSIPGRVEDVDAGQDFAVIVDYAHTADSLEKLYKVFRPDPATRDGRRLIAVMGGTGGGRDAWKRSVMGGLADSYCDAVILTNEDPYDEDPMEIIAGVAKGVVSKEPEIILDRRHAIRRAVSMARKGDVVLITGKGTDPYIMGPRGSKIPWSDADVAREELVQLREGARADEL